MSTSLDHHLRRASERLVFRELLEAAPASRAAIAEATGLSAPAVGKAVEVLVKAGLVEEMDPPEQADDNRGVGRPSRPLRISESGVRFLALQLGVRRTRIGALPVAGPIHEQWSHDLPTARSAAAWESRLRRLAQRADMPQPWAVTLSVPGVVDESASRVLLSPNLHWTASADLPGIIRRIWDVPVVLVQEIRALAMGHLAAEPTDRNFLLVDFGEGVGGAAVVNGNLYQGATALSGELGHAVVAGNERPCGCGAVGCMETLLSRGGLINSLSRQLHCRTNRRSQQPPPPAREQPVDWDRRVKHVNQHGVEPWLHASLDAAGQVIAASLNVLGLRRVVVTGSLTELPSDVLLRLRESIEQHAMWARFGSVECVPAPRRWAAGLVAAAIHRLLLGDVPRGANLEAPAR